MQILCEFLNVQWLHFTAVVDKVIIANFQFFSGFYIPKIIKIGSFLTELLKIEMSPLFETRCTLRRRMANRDALFG